jgi:ABC-2 type transport system permease protein
MNTRFDATSPDHNRCDIDTAADAHHNAEPVHSYSSAGIAAYWHCFAGILMREYLRFIQQRSRFLSSLVRPLLWLVVFAAGFRAALGVAIIPPYETYITYETYIAPGLCCMILLFNGMQSSLSMVYDREMGSMRVLLMSPLPRSWLLLCKLMAIGLISLTQVYAFLALAWLAVDLEPPLMGYVTALPALFLTALLLGAIGLFLSSHIRQLENFAGVMNFVIFPMFFISSALYPLWKMREASEWLYWLCLANPFTHAVELVRHALYGQLNPLALAITAGATLVFALLAILGFNPERAAGGGKVKGER